ncbi:MAG: hypothetical protein ACKORE_03490, partial [Bacteroidota bacterium]
MRFFLVSDVLFTEAKKSPDRFGTPFKGTAKKGAGQVFFHQVNVNFTLPPGEPVFPSAPQPKN